MIFNLAPNPSFEDGFNGWELIDPQYTRTLETSGGWDGDEFYRAVCIAALDTAEFGLLDSSLPITARAGQTYTLSMYLRPVAGASGKKVQMTLAPRDSTGTLIPGGAASAWGVLVAGWNRYSVTHTMPVGSATVDLVLFDRDDTTGNGTFAVGDGVDIDAVMLNEGATAATYTNLHPALKRQGSRNYDIDQLTIQTATPGFIIGQSIIGESVLGPDSNYEQIGRFFTSIIVSQPCTVEDGLFVHREVDSCVVTTTKPEHLDLKGQRIWINYGSKVVFLGTVSETTLTESVQVGAPQLPGNTATRTHRVALRCTAGEEFFATQLAPARAFTTESITTRLASYMGLSSVDFNADSDVDAAVMNNVGDAIAARTITTLADERRTLLETFRDLLRRHNRYYRYLPWASRIDSESASRTASGDGRLSNALRFTDDPELTGVGSAIYQDHTSEQRTVSYSERTESEDPSMFTTGVTVITGAAGAEVTHGPFLTSGTSRRQDVTIELGAMNLADRVPQAIRNWVATMPLKAMPTRFTSRLRAPLQSIHQVQTRVPAVATLERVDVGSELIAILGTTHTITPDRWLIDYECGPPHLLTRVGDLDPSPPRSLTVSQAGAGGAVTLNWLSPDSIPTTRPIYAQVRGITPPATFPGGFEPSDAAWSLLSNVEVPLPLPAGTPQAAVIPFASLSAGSWGFWVQYTTDPTPGDSTFDPTHLIGQTTYEPLTLT